MTLFPNKCSFWGRGSWDFAYEFWGDTIQHQHVGPICWLLEGNLRVLFLHSWPALVGSVTLNLPRMGKFVGNLLPRCTLSGGSMPSCISTFSAEIRVILVLCGVNCYLDGLWNHLTGGPLGMSVGESLYYLNWYGKTDLFLFGLFVFNTGFHYGVLAGLELSV